MKFNEKLKAIEFRKKGVGFGQILKEVRVSKSTLSLWLRDVEVDKDIKEKILVGRELSRRLAAESRKQQRKINTAAAIEQGTKEFSRLSNNPLFLAGLCLYWAEGDKHKQERVKFTNSDEKMIFLMMKWFREICEVPEEKFRIALHVHNLHVANDVKNYWSQITGVPESQFQKIYVKPTTLRQRRNILYNGTCGIVVSNKALFRRISGWKISLLGYLSP